MGNDMKYMSMNKSFKNYMNDKYIKNYHDCDCKDVLMLSPIIMYVG